MKKKIAVLLCLAIVLSILPVTGMADELPQLSAEAFILINSDNGEVLYEQNSRMQRYPASVTKMMTLLVAVEAVEKELVSLDDLVQVSIEAAYTGGSTMYLRIDEQIPFNDLLYGLAMVSGNDASVAIAEHVCGSVEQFVAAMNDKAQQLDMRDTHFANPNGLRADDHYTTAYDLSILAQEAVKHPLFLQITGTKEYAVRIATDQPTILVNSNELLGEYEGMDGLKTGWIGVESGYCLATTAKRDDVRLIAIVLGAPTRPESFSDSEKLLDYGFSHFQYTHLLDAYESVAQVKVENGNQAKVKIGVGESVDCLVDQDHIGSLTTVYQLDQKLVAPLQKDQYVGRLEVMNEVKNEVVATYDLIVLETVNIGNFWQKILYFLINFF